MTTTTFFYLPLKRNLFLGPTSTTLTTMSQRHYMKPLHHPQPRWWPGVSRPPLGNTRKGTSLPTSVSVALEPLSSDPLRNRDRLHRTGTSTGLPKSSSISSLGTRWGESGSSSVLMLLMRSSSLHSLTSDTAEQDEMVRWRFRKDPMSTESWSDGLTHISVPRTIVVAFCWWTEVIYFPNYFTSFSLFFMLFFLN